MGPDEHKLSGRQQAKAKMQERMNQCKIIASNLISECPDIHCNDINQYLYNEIRDYQNKIYYNLLEEILKGSSFAIEIIKELPGYKKYLEAKERTIYINDNHQSNDTFDYQTQDRPKRRTKRITIESDDKKPQSEESKKLKMAFWLIDQIGSEDEALHVLKAAIQARKTINGV